MVVVYWSRRFRIVVFTTASFVARNNCLAFTRNAGFTTSKRVKRASSFPKPSVSLNAKEEHLIQDLPPPKMQFEDWGGEHARDARIAARLVSDATKLCLEYQKNQQQQEFETAGTSATTIEKKDGTPVTALDYAIQGCIISSLKKHEEDGRLASSQRVSFVGEEDAQDLRDARQQSLAAMALNLAQSLDPNLTMKTFLDALDHHGQEKDASSDENDFDHSRSWILDPIDGTRGLLQGKQYCIGLALCIEGNVVVGVLGNPNAFPNGASSGVMVAVQRHGLRYYNYDSDAFLDLPRNILNSWHTKHYDFAELTASSFSSISLKQPKQAGIDYPPFLLSMGPKTKAKFKPRQPPAPFGPLCQPNQLCCGSLVKYFAVASGHVAGFVQLSPASSGRVNSWDHAPGMLCVQESGGSVVVVGPEESVNQQVDVDANINGNSTTSNRLPLFDQPQFYIHDGMACFAKEASAAIRRQIIDSLQRE